MTNRHPIKKHCFEKIKELGIPINTILDVGVMNNTYDLMEAFPDKQHLLFEPVAEWYPKIHSSYSSKNIKYHLFEMACSNKDGTICLETETHRSHLPVTHSRITSSATGSNLRSVKTRRLDTLLPEFNYQPPYLLKLDVDGAELDIFEGAHGILEQCNIIVIEANIKNLPLRVEAVSKAGFTLFNIVDFCYYDGRLRQVDLVFTNNTMLDRMNLDMYKMPFKISKWETYNPYTFNF
jgi:FkbM family methyltransferase